MNALGPMGFVLSVVLGFAWGDYADQTLHWAAFPTLAAWLGMWLVFWFAIYFIDRLLNASCFGPQKDKS